MGIWSVPRSSDSMVLAQTSGGTQPKGGAQARFRAATGGSSTLTASSAPRCAPMCKIADRLWTVTVKVTGAGTQVTATEADNGGIVALRRGGTLTVTLHSTYWTINGSSAPAVLHQTGPATTSPAPPSQHCVPGQGCGTVTATFSALTDGKADVTASRTSCGEALRCTPAQSSWVVHVVVTG
jgi:hypothetical protein